MSRDEWLDAASAADDDELRERILTGFKDGKPFTPYEPTIPLPSSITRVLDFGCGLGRNFPYLKKLAPSLAGLDLPPMIARCRALDASAGVDLFDDWSALRGERFDLVFAALVLQHIDREARLQFIDDFSPMAPHVYVLSRGASDDGGNVIDDIARAGRYEIDACREVEHDPMTHQLRVVAADVPLAHARRVGNAAHYELLLRAIRR